MALKISKRKLVLILILFLAAFLRLYRLGHYPPLNADEAAIGYNAWSILKTGRDEHGGFLPLHFKSFGDYKPGGYFYVVLPFVGFLGLNEWAVRLPSVLAGILTVWLVYQLAKLLWKNEKLGLIWAFVLTISPWHIHFSRGGWESNFALFLIILGVYFFYKFLSTRLIKYFILHTSYFILSLYIYHSARIIAPVLFLGLVLFNWKFFWQSRKQIIAPLVFGFLLLIPLVFSFLKGGASSRFSGVGLFADTGPFWRVNELLNQHEGKGFPFVRLIHNRFIIYGISFAQKYFSHFNGQFLFIDGDDVPRSKVPDMGVMHLFEVGFLILGIWFWLRGKRKYKYLPFLLLITGPLASAMTFQAPSALRSLPMVVPLTFFVSYGIINIINLLNKKFAKLTICYLLSIIYLFSLCYWQDRYFTHYLKRFPSAWPDFRPVANWVKNNGDQYEKICITGNYDQPYILALFYLQYPPEKIQKEIKLTPPDEFGFSTVENFGKYYFGNCQDFDGKIIHGSKY